MVADDMLCTNEQSNIWKAAVEVNMNDNLSKFVNFLKKILYLNLGYANQPYIC